MHQNQQVILSLLFQQASHEGRTYSLPKLQKSSSHYGSAKYKLTFKGQWTKADHPQGFPEGRRPHFSPIVGCSHNASYVMWRPGQPATKGVQNVAEFGRSHTIYVYIYIILYIIYRYVYSIYIYIYSMQYKMYNTVYCPNICSVYLVIDNF